MRQFQSCPPGGMEKTVPESSIRGVPNQVEDLHGRSPRNYWTSTGGSNLSRSNHQVIAPNFKRELTKPIWKELAKEH